VKGKKQAPFSLTKPAPSPEPPARLSGEMNKTYWRWPLMWGPRNILEGIAKFVQLMCKEKRLIV
jgi:hypothetical protein